MIRLCRYSGLNDHPREALVASRQVTDSKVIDRLVREADELPPFPPGAIACPADWGTQVLALLSYPDARHVTIQADLTGCGAVTNGDVIRNGSGSQSQFDCALLRLTGYKRKNPPT